MRLLIGLIVLVSFPGCSSARLMKCTDKMSDPAVKLCPDSLGKGYYLCEKPPAELRVCEEPQ